MADQNGVRGGLVSPRVHLPVRSPRAVASPPEPVTLLQPRPDVQRRVNEYVETPLRPICDDERTSVGVPRHLPSGARHKRVVTKQPGQTFKKDSAGPSASGAGTGGADQCSIICRECGRCRCEACRQPRPVPSLWLCHNFCLCSTESCVDYGSCLCCVKGLMYHCASRDGDDDTCADDPCSCGPHRRLGRWTCLGLTSLCLPCLCCYWPLRALASAAESCYARCTSRGCRCETRHSRPELTPEKRLLHPSPEL
ncbi:protein sprouty homolog 3 [Homalodisca vitripennis]|nr:protein sprouty homolog 3 [Homalodisca vitripennis]XP_046674291.1 protein sprouty homolog 3 [Homalodisca vitripennis]KAG8273178.1 negative regulation of neurotrophin TRK receptor signaling pathway [Homalodisca vitripennis]